SHQFAGTRKLTLLTCLLDLQLGGLLGFFLAAFAFSYPPTPPSLNQLSSFHLDELVHEFECLLAQQLELRQYFAEGRPDGDQAEQNCHREPDREYVHLWRGPRHHTKRQVDEQQRSHGRQGNHHRCRKHPPHATGQEPERGAIQ